MAALTHLFEIGQHVKYKNDDFDAVKKFIPCVVKETYPDHIIITDTETNTDLWCEEGLNMDCVFPDYEYKITELAEALTYIDIERLDMGDSHEEIVEFLCEKAAIEFDGECSDEDENYYEKKSIEAYKKMIKDGSIQELVGSIVDEIYDNFDYLRIVMVHHEYKSAVIEEHPTTKAILVINDYIQSINDEAVCSKEHCSKMNEIKRKLLSMDLELCYVGHTLGYSFFRYLNPEYYFRSNDVFTVGHILSEDENERKLGEYTIHAEVLSIFRKSGGDQGYTISFNREDGNIVAHIYLYAKTHDPFNMVHKDTGCEMTMDVAELDLSAKELADKINELTEKDFANGKELQDGQMVANAVRKRRGR